MSQVAGKVVVLIDHALSDTQCEALAATLHPDDAVTAVTLNESAGQGALASAWQVVSAAELFDGDQLREEFLAFLNDWPNKPLVRGKGFDQLFSHADGTSLWWTGPGIRRHPDKGVFLTLRSVWLAKRALDTLSPDSVALALADNHAATAIRTLLAREGIDTNKASFPAPSLKPFAGRLRWLMLSLLWLAVVPWELLIRSIIARLCAGRGAAKAADKPVVALASAYPRHARFPADGPMELTFWRELETLLVDGDQPVTVRHLLHTVPGQLAGHRHVGRWRHTAWPVLKGRQDVLPLQETHWPIGAYLKSLPRQIAALFRYYRLEGNSAFRESFRFAGADVSNAYVPLLRRAVSRQAGWEMTVAAVSACLHRAGNIRALLVCEELYPMGMGDIAAARQLGIPAIGIQHGTLFPMHLIYTVPAGQVTGSPIPDRMAVFGEYDRDVLSQVGRFPAELIVVTGSQRLDHLVSNPPDQATARKELNLPADRKILLLATQFYPWFTQVGKALFAAVAGREDCIVCVKTHPRDVPLAVYEELAGEAGAANVRFFDSHFDELLAACDVLVSGSSTTVLEAILLGRGAICANFSDEPDRYPYVADGGALPARDATQMKHAVDEVLAGDLASMEQGRQRFIARHVGSTARGEGAAAIVALVHDCLADEREDA